MSEIGDHAVVLGASMGGLLAARVLADAYRQVTIAERDPLPQSGLDRKGVPQGRACPRAVAARGANPGRAFPGAAARPGRRRCPGAPPSAGDPDLAGGHLPCQHGEPGEPYQPSLAIPGKPGSQVGPGPAQRHNAGPLRCGWPGHHTGPRPGYRCPGAAAHRRRRRGTDSGRRSRGRRDRPHRAYGGVAQRTRLRPAGRGADPGGHQIRQPVPAAAPRSTRGGKAGHDRRRTRTAHHHGACRAGRRPLDPDAGRVLRPSPAARPDGFLAFAQRLAPAEVFAAISDAEPLGEISTHRFPANLRRRYEQLRSFPAGCWWRGTLCAASTRSTGKA